MLSSLNRLYLIAYFVILYLSKIYAGIFYSQDPFVFFRISNILTIGISSFFIFLILVINKGRINKPSTGGLKIIFVLNMMMALYSVINGMLFEWSIIYLVYDVASIVIQLTIALIFMDFKYSKDDFGGLIQLNLIMSLITAAIFNLFNVNGFAVPQQALNLLIVGVIIGALNKNQKIIMALVLALTFSDLNRASLVAALFAYAIYSLSGSSKRILKFSFVMTAILITASSLFSLPFLNGTQLGRRINEFSIIISSDGRDIPTALETRLFETRYVLDAIDNANILHKVSGFGAGAEIDISNSNDVSVKSTQLLDGDKAHNIHILPIAHLYRFGIVGVCILIISSMYAYVLFKFKRSKRQMHLYWVISLVNGLFASSYFYTDHLAFASMVVEENDENNPSG